MVIPLSWNIKSLSDPLYSRTLRIWLLVQCLQVYLLLQGVGTFLVASYITLATTLVTHPSSLEEGICTASIAKDLQLDVRNQNYQFLMIIFG